MTRCCIKREYYFPVCMVALPPPIFVLLTGVQWNTRGRFDRFSPNTLFFLQTTVGTREMAAPCTSITDERLAVLLEEIFLRLPTPADHVRASVALHQVDSVRQLLADRSFLRRFRKTHSPSFIGFVDYHGFRPALPPHTSAPIADAVGHAADFSFSFLPRPNRCSFTGDPGCWNVRDIRDGRVLLDRGPKREKGSVVFPELAVCDPLHRRYRLLPPIPNDLAVLVRDSLDLFYSPKRRCGVVLVPAIQEGEGEVEPEDDETSFRVVWMAQCRTKPMAFVYSSTSGQWQGIASEGWSNLLGCATPVSLESRLFQRCANAYGCLYWPMFGPESGLENYPREVMLVLDTMRMEFSVADLPAGRRWRGGGFGIVEAGEGRLGLITHSNDGTLQYIVRQNTDMNEWQIEKIIPLAEGDHTIIRVTERYLLVLRSDVRIDCMTFQVERLYEKSECFSLDVKTFKLERKQNCLACEEKDISTFLDSIYVRDEKLQKVSW
ncbi:hypothetical protein VPH35_139957 [Triticum aestivum]|uniref:Uncharacterized protein n=1 Tax=Aegilops tauschii TaxID=37682 RepID=R7WDY5_AEGTA